MYICLKQQAMSNEHQTGQNPGQPGHDGNHGLTVDLKYMQVNCISASVLQKGNPLCGTSHISHIVVLQFYHHVNAAGQICLKDLHDGLG